MDIIDISTLLAATVVAAVLASFVLARLIRQDGYGNRPAPTSRPDWGSSSIPSRPYSSRL
jgi:hypothetical protein